MTKECERLSKRSRMKLGRRKEYQILPVNNNQSKKGTRFAVVLLRYFLSISIPNNIYIFDFAVGVFAGTRWFCQ